MMGKRLHERGTMKSNLGLTVEVFLSDLFVIKSENISVFSSIKISTVFNLLIRKNG